VIMVLDCVKPRKMRPNLTKRKPGVVAHSSPSVIHVITRRFAAGVNTCRPSSNIHSLQGGAGTEETFEPSRCGRMTASWKLLTTGEPANARSSPVRKLSTAWWRSSPRSPSPRSSSHVCPPPLSHSRRRRQSGLGGIRAIAHPMPAIVAIA
jgi:hypothetical protein